MSAKTLNKFEYVSRNVKFMQIKCCFRNNQEYIMK